MKERPILMSAPMVRAIIEGRKTVTRRPIRYPTEQRYPSWEHTPYGRPGDRLWVRETWARYRATNGIAYRADYTLHTEPRDLIEGRKWKPSIFMRRVDSRLLLEIVSIQVERLNVLTMEQAIAEGFGSPDEFAYLWSNMHPHLPISTHPWVWVINFRRVKS